MSSFKFEPFELENVEPWLDTVSENLDLDHFEDVQWEDKRPYFEPELTRVRSDADGDSNWDGSRDPADQVDCWTGTEWSDDSGDPLGNYGDYNRGDDADNSAGNFPNELDFFVGNNHYKMDFDEKARGFHKAKGKCEAKEMELLGGSLTDEEDFETVTNKLKSITHMDLGHIMTGVRVLPRPIGWGWEHEGARKRFNWLGGWAENEPKYDIKARCAAMTPNGWISQHCDKKLQYYVCLGRNLPHSVAKKNDKKKKYGVRFFLRSGLVDYQGAVDGCAENGWILAPIPSDKENNGLYDILAESTHIRKAWIGLRTHTDDIDLSWQFSNGEDLDFDLVTEAAFEEGQNQALEAGKPLCLAYFHQIDSLKWELIDCTQQNARFMCSSSARRRRRSSRGGRRRPDGQPEVTRHRRVIQRTDPVLKSFQLTLPEGYEFLFEDWEEVPISVQGHLDYDWKWPRYGVLADQKRCVDVISETYQNLSTSIGQIDLLSNEAEVKASIISEFVSSHAADIENHEIYQQAIELWEIIRGNLVTGAHFVADLRDVYEDLVLFWDILGDMSRSDLEEMIEDYELALDDNKWSCDNPVIQDYMDKYPNVRYSESAEDQFCAFVFSLVDEARRRVLGMENEVEDYISSTPILSEVRNTICEDVDPKLNDPETREGIELFCFVGETNQLEGAQEVYVENAGINAEDFDEMLNCFKRGKKDMDCYLGMFSIIFQSLFVN